MNTCNGQETDVFVKDEKVSMGRYIVERSEGFVLRGRPHPLDRPGQPDWLIDLAYDESRVRLGRPSGEESL